jgi:hypothetical protein
MLTKAVVNSAMCHILNSNSIDDQAHEAVQVDGDLVVLQGLDGFAHFWCPELFHVSEKVVWSIWMVQQLLLALFVPFCCSPVWARMHMCRVKTIGQGMGEDAVGHPRSVNATECGGPISFLNVGFEVMQNPGWTNVFPYVQVV